MEVTEQHRRFFEAFGYLVLPGAMKDDVDWISEEFEQVFRDQGVEHDGTHRSCLVPFIDSRQRLCELLDHPLIESLLERLVGPDANYIGSDGNYYSGDTGWHADGMHRIGCYLKIAFYLDAVDRDSGALRVIPGSHQVAALDSQVRQAAKSEELWGIPGHKVPAVTLESRPGDLVLFNHNLMHSSWGGTSRRRMFTMNIAQHCSSPEEIEELKAYIATLAGFGNDTTHSELMRSGASASRVRHLRQVIDNEGHLSALAAKAQAQMPQPDR